MTETKFRPQRSQTPVTRVVSPRLRRLLYVVFALTGLLAGNGAYLATITGMEWFTGHTYQNYFYQFMFLGHLVLGLLLVVPFLIFGLAHMLAARKRKKKMAVRIGYALFATGIVALGTGLLLMRIGGFDLKQPAARSTVYWLHVLLPLGAAWLYVLHRLAGPRIKWKVGLGYAGAVAAVTLAMVLLHSHDPREWHTTGPASGARYFEPSLARTSTGDFIPAKSLMNDGYCKKCHADVHSQWAGSAHHGSSFSNPVYFASVAETRETAMQIDGNVQASRWCAGCHDAVPFFSGAFDDPEFDMLSDSTAGAGITCSVCHSITNVNTTQGNASYTIEEPAHYPFAYSDNSVLQWINNQLVKAKPSFHKQSMLKPFHKTAEFCSVCHKVNLPGELTRYKEFLRGQNHYDSYLLSGVSGHGARSFYYPPTAQANCNGCHMPLVASDDFGAAFFKDAKQLSVHNHLFPGANTGLPWLHKDSTTVALQQDFLKEALRVDIFGVREGGAIDGKLTAPLQKQAAPELSPGKSYLLEVVIRTLKVGHHFTQGTVDSNEVWLDVTVRSGDRIIGRSGDMDASQGNEVDPYAHRVNVFMLDNKGQRISRRNAQDIYTPFYNHQMPPGAGQTVHYEIVLPDDLKSAVTVEVTLNYRKFDQHLMQFTADKNREAGRTIRGDNARSAEEPGVYMNKLPVTLLATDKLTFPLAGQPSTAAGQPAAKPVTAESGFPEWQRWNDYGIGLLLTGRSQLRQAQEAFREVEKRERWDGPLNLARAYNSEGLLDEATAALQRAAKHRDKPGFPHWTWAWLSGVVNRQQGNFPAAIQNLRTVVDSGFPSAKKRGFDFSYDYMVLNELGGALFDLGSKRQRQDRLPEAQQHWQEAVKVFHRTLAIDSENAPAHYHLGRLYEVLSQPELAEKHRQLHARYKVDDSARNKVLLLASQKYPAASHAAAAVVKYPLQRRGAPGLPANENRQTSQAERQDTSHDTSHNKDGAAADESNPPEPDGN